MKKLRKWLLLFSMVGPTVVNLSCSNALLTDVREAALSAVSSFITDATMNVLDQVNPLGTMAP